MSELDRLKKIAELVDYTFDRSKLTETIRSYSKLPRMLGIATLLKANDCQYNDGASVIEIETPRGKFIFPKDGYTDGYRFQEAIARKTAGGNGMICLPAIDGVMVGAKPADKWSFKEEWDHREVSSTKAVYGGDFMTKAEDHLDDEDEFQALDLTEDIFYHNVLLSKRDARDFGKVNPDMDYIPCEGMCMTKPHVHAVAGKYEGAQVMGLECAPPFDLHPRWGDFPPLRPDMEQVVEIAVDKASGMLQQLDTAAQGAAKKQQAAASAVQDKKLGKASAGEGVETLENFIKSTDTSWTSIKALYSEPKTAKWAAAEHFSTSKSGQKKVKADWNKKFESHILPYLEGEGSPLKMVLEKIWACDSDKRKFMANYMVRRLVVGGFVQQADNGNLFHEN